MDSVVLYVAEVLQPFELNSIKNGRGWKNQHCHFRYVGPRSSSDPDWGPSFQMIRFVIHFDQFPPNIAKGGSSPRRAASNNTSSSATSLSPLCRHRRRSETARDAWAPERAVECTPPVGQFANPKVFTCDCPLYRETRAAPGIPMASSSFALSSRVLLPAPVAGLCPPAKASLGTVGAFYPRGSRILAFLSRRLRLLRVRAVQDNNGNGGSPRRLVDIVRLVPEISRNYFKSPARRALFGGIALLGGFYVAQTISLSFGALGVNDVIAAVVCVLLTEYVTRFYYSRPKVTFPLALLNNFKMGFTYGLFIDAFKLAS
ncbi:hypothetical protein Taro_037724 [Colocasia esculenta]|uniref:Ycf20-like protein n=1 Tax=Colocasia esculenta TaxID=4460 RepID=A0A843WH39_COLES|nr:hypothetical protein [Colocasia esculenta]